MTLVVPALDAVVRLTPAETSAAIPGIALAYAALLVAYARAIRNANPTMPETSTARSIAFGMTRCGSWVSSARLLADSKPTMV